MQTSMIIEHEQMCGSSQLEHMISAAGTGTVDSELATGMPIEVDPLRALQGCNQIQ